MLLPQRDSLARFFTQLGARTSGESVALPQKTPEQIAAEAEASGAPISPAVSNVFSKVFSKAVNRVAGFPANLVKPEAGGTDNDEEASLKDFNPYLPGVFMTPAQMQKMGALLTSSGNFYMSLMGIETAEERKKREQEEEFHRAFMNSVAGYLTPSQWDMQMTNYGGVQMTNAEAQKLRKQLVDNFDDYFDRCIRDGRLREEERERLRQLAQREYELAEKMRNNGGSTKAFTAQENQDWEEIQNSEEMKELRLLQLEGKSEFKLQTDRDSKQVPGMDISRQRKDNVPIVSASERLVDISLTNEFKDCMILDSAVINVGSLNGSADKLDPSTAVNIGPAKIT